MDLIQAIVYGLIQGATEFLPISSSGHLLLPDIFLGWKDPGAGFTAVIQLGTLLAVFIFFWSDIVTITKAFFKGLGDKAARDNHDFKMAIGLLIGSVPIAVLGLAIEKQIDSTFRTPTIIATTLLVFGLLMGVADRVGKKQKSVEDMTTGDMVKMGLWQCLALVPGSSRSGSTITGGLFAGFDRAAAARASFLLSIPSVLGSGLYKLYKERHDLMGAGATPTIVATIVAFVSGWVAIAFLMSFLKNKSLNVFVVYRVVLSLVIFGHVLANRGA